VLPCGAGKTVIGMAAMAQAGARTLVLATSILAARQWIAELCAKTSLTRDDVGEYSGERKEIRPVTVATYQVLTWRDPQAADEAELGAAHPHLGLFDNQGWGLVIYDEVHLLPAPVFRATAQIQAVRRPAPQRYRLAAGASQKLQVLDALVARHRDDRVLVIGQYLDQLEAVATRLDAPLVTGRTAQPVREQRFAEFRDGRLPVLVVSKVANFSIDLPEANVAVQLSGTFGSRQEEAQRLGRILRPKADGGPARFYTVVTRETVDQAYAVRRQRFLAEQGYTYTIVDAEQL
ncbi:MAG: DEAD/DEAH box helicase, partial [Actinomycetota bacterium]|nr:DEAD/DEAH box helicase [Actinomycetota bacterium]